MKTLLAHFRVLLLTLVICAVAYPLFTYAAGRLLTPATAAGSLLYSADGRLVGSRLIAQSFSQPRYFWPRPSAVAYDASAAGGTNLAPTSLALRELAAARIALHGATPAAPLPADLATASGGGLDPHLTEAAALYQVPRVAAARGLPIATVSALVAAQAERVAGPFDDTRIVNVLALNLALDAATLRP